MQTKASSLIELDDRGVRLTLFVDRWEWLVPLILSYGTSILVEEPLELRRAVAEALEQTLALYRGSSLQTTEAFASGDSRRRATRGRPRD